MGILSDTYRVLILSFRFCLSSFLTFPCLCSFSHPPVWVSVAVPLCPLLSVQPSVLVICLSRRGVRSETEGQGPQRGAGPGSQRHDHPLDASPVPSLLSFPPLSLCSAFSSLLLIPSSFFLFFPLCYTSSPPPYPYIHLFRGSSISFLVPSFVSVCHSTTLFFFFSFLFF